MKIQELFAKDINRTIKGVVQVGQDTDSIIKQEVEEYVITKELKKRSVNEKGTMQYMNCTAFVFKVRTDITITLQGIKNMKLEMML